MKRGKDGFLFRRSLLLLFFVVALVRLWGVRVRLWGVRVRDDVFFSSQPFCCFLCCCCCCWRLGCSCEVVCGLWVCAVELACEGLFCVARAGFCSAGSSRLWSKRKSGVNRFAREQQQFLLQTGASSIFSIWKRRTSQWGKLPANGRRDAEE